MPAQWSESSRRLPGGQLSLLRGLPRVQEQFRKERLGSGFTQVRGLLLASWGLGNCLEDKTRVPLSASLPACSLPGHSPPHPGASRFWCFSGGQGAFCRTGLQDVATSASLGPRGPGQFRSTKLSRGKTLKLGKKGEKDFRVGSSTSTSTKFHSVKNKVGTSEGKHSTCEKPSIRVCWRTSEKSTKR